MPLINVVGGYDGVTFPPGTTNQSTAPGLDIGGALESGGAGNPLGAVSPSSNGYLAWSMAPSDATQSVAIGATATSFGWLTKVYAAVGGACGHLDMVTATGAPATITGAVFALYNSASFAVGPLAWTASRTQAFFTAANTAFSVPWDGTSSPASVGLVAGQAYWVYTTVTFSSTGVLTLAANSTTNAPVYNINQTASATSANESMTLSPAPVLFGSVGAASTLAPQTSWANSNSKFWFGLKV